MKRKITLPGQVREKSLKAAMKAINEQLAAIHHDVVTAIHRGIQRNK